jgi:transcriptional regulator with XRE-family HTH domain
MKIRRKHENSISLHIRQPTSKLTFDVTPFEFEFRISGPISSRGRRTLLLMVYRKMRELFGTLDKAEINHARRNFFSSLFPFRPLSLRETPMLDTPNAKAGYSLRLIRHRNRLTLREVAELSGVDLSHLSCIERGKHTPSPDTVRRIESALARYEEEGILCLSATRTRHPKNFPKMRSAPETMEGPLYLLKWDEFQQTLAKTRRVKE